MFSEKTMRLAVLSLVFFGLPAFGAETLTIDSSHSAVIFSWSHFGFTNPVARLERIEGTVVLDGAIPANSSVSVRLLLAGLHTGDESLDKRLKTDEFLDAQRFPVISFRSKQVEAFGKDGLKIRGDLTIHGVTESIILDAKINRIGVNPISKLTTAGFDTDVVLRRSDFGVSKYVPAITDELHVHITLGADLQKNE
jgi:polyisoprenoid-binding protein YceI